MSTSIQLARIGALQAYHDANGRILYGFEPFIKDIYYPATTMLKDIGDWEPLDMLTPRFSRVIKWPSIMEICQRPPTWESISIKGHEYIFNCPRTWNMEEEPVSPDPKNSPEVAGNQYTKGKPRYRSNSILDALIKWRLLKMDPLLSNLSRLNKMIALTA